MNNLIAFFRLLRPINLFLIAATCYALRHFILLPYLAIQPVEMKLFLQPADFLLMTLMFVFLTAAGNIINDYFDLRVDRINKPHRIVIDKYVKRRVAMAAHIAFNVLGVLIGLYLSWRVGNPLLAALPFFIAGSLWYYSVSFKKQFLIGNVVVALMAALLPAMIGLYEIPGLFTRYIDSMSAFYEQHGIIGSPGDFFASLWYWLLGYSALGFILTLVREILKDIEDIEGDSESGYKTLAILWGRKKAGLLSIVLILVTLAALIKAHIYLLEGQPIIAHLIFSFSLYLPMTLSLWFTIKANNRNAYRNAGTSIKLAMLGMLVITFLFGVLINPALLG